jgi:late competence protein required for DNA uptake (superfamily II DNA/RNA helicase)
MFQINDYSSNSVIEEFRNNNSSSIIIHEHDFVPIRLKEEEKQKSIICLTCGSFYCEKCGKLLVSTTISDEKLIQHSNTLCYCSKE